MGVRGEVLSTPTPFYTDAVHTVGVAIVGEVRVGQAALEDEAREGPVGME